MQLIVRLGVNMRIMTFVEKMFTSEGKCLQIQVSFSSFFVFITFHLRFPLLLDLGLMLLFCTTCGRPQGFFPLTESECERQFFETVFCRWELPPPYICYDNACNLYVYSLLREPDFFLHCLPVVDRLHHRNHINCPNSFNMNMFAHLDKVNSQVMEQTNARLRRLRTMFAYMKYPHYCFFLRLFLFIDYAFRQLPF
jgi:hypothetical protein